MTSSDQVPDPGNTEADKQRQASQTTQVNSNTLNPNYTNTSSIGFLKAIGWIDLTVGIIAAIIIFANAKKTVPGAYLPYTKVTLPDKEVTDPFAIALALAIVFQGITAAVLFSVIASLAENVIVIRKQINNSK